MVTEKQKQILLKDGYSDAEISRMEYAEVSEAIGEILRRPRTQGGVTTRPQKQVERVEFRPVAHASASQYVAKPKDTQSFWVAYSKDLCIAMLNAHTQKSIANPKIEPIEVRKLMAEAVECIVLAKQRFE